MLGRQTWWWGSSHRRKKNPDLFSRADLFSIQDPLPVFNPGSSLFPQNAFVVGIYKKINKEEHYKWRRETVQPHNLSMWTTSSLKKAVNPLCSPLHVLWIHRKSVIKLPGWEEIQEKNGVWRPWKKEMRKKQRGRERISELQPVFTSLCFSCHLHSFFLSSWILLSFNIYVASLLTWTDLN